MGRALEGPVKIMIFFHTTISSYRSSAEQFIKKSRNLSLFGEVLHYTERVPWCLKSATLEVHPELCDLGDCAC